MSARGKYYTAVVVLTIFLIIIIANESLQGTPLPLMLIVVIIALAAVGIRSSNQRPGDGAPHA